MQAALESEIRFTGQFNALPSAAQDAPDHRSLQFLQWFIEEQVEEVLDLIDSGMNLFAAGQLLEGQA